MECGVHRRSVAILTDQSERSPQKLCKSDDLEENYFHECTCA